MKREAERRCLPPSKAAAGASLLKKGGRAGRGGRERAAFYSRREGRPVFFFGCRCRLRVRCVCVCKRFCCAGEDKGVSKVRVCTTIIWEGGAMSDWKGEVQR